MRETLDPVEPERLRPALTAGVRALQRGQVLDEMVCVEGHTLLALDGTGYCSSKALHCESCLAKHHHKGTVTYSHQMLGAALLHPARRAVMPCMPEPIIRQDGTEKNACARNAAKRFVTKFPQGHPPLKVLGTAESLSANAPHLETRQDHHMPYILGVKEGDHAFLFEQGAPADRTGRVTADDRDDRHAQVPQRLRVVSNLPRNASPPALRVNCIECWETMAAGKAQPLSGITD